MSFIGHTVLDAAPSPITATDKTDEARETRAEQEDVDTATTSKHRIIQAWSSMSEKKKKTLKVPEQTKVYAELIQVFKSLLN